MIKVENIDVWGFEHAIRGMRNPMNSWNKSDSEYESANFCDHDFKVGENDLELMRKLYKAGTEHRTYARMIQVSMDITAPLYWWKEMDRYTVGKSQVSCSTMHKITEKEFTVDDFSHEHLIDEEIDGYECSIIDQNGIVTDINSSDMLDMLVRVLNCYRDCYIKTKYKKYWWQLIQLLPSSYNQKRTVCMSYETVFKIIRERIGHKLDEWNEFVNLLCDELPYIRDIMQEDD